MATREIPTPATNISDQEQSDTQPVIGIVTNCKKLNLRTKPSKAATIIYEMPAGSSLTINLSRSVNGWLSVCTESGLTGFCMKKFVFY